MYDADVKRSAGLEVELTGCPTWSRHTRVKRNEQAHHVNRRVEDEEQACHVNRRVEGKENARDVNT